MRTAGTAMLCLLLSACVSHEQACDQEAAKTIAESFLQRVMLSEDCLMGLKNFDADAFWMDECKRRGGPGKALRSEFNRRTTGSVDGIRSKDGRTYAILRFLGPDQLAFHLALMREGFCEDVQHGGLLPPFPGRTGCGERFWNDIPVREWLGALPLDCRSGHWVVGSEKGSK